MQAILINDAYDLFASTILLDQKRDHKCVLGVGWGAPNKWNEIMRDCYSYYGIYSWIFFFFIQLFNTSSDVHVCIIIIIIIIIVVVVVVTFF